MVVLTEISRVVVKMVMNKMEIPLQTIVLSDTIVGTFKYKKNAEKHLKLIKNKYPKTTSNKDAYAALIKSNGRQLYESRFQFFTKKDAKSACARLKKYKRDCFIRG